MPNKEIEFKILVSGFMKWQVAEAIGIADTTFSKWLRRELSAEKKIQILLAIEKMSEEAKVNG